MKLNIFRTDEIKALSKGTVDERFEHLGKEIYEKLDKYGSNLILKEKIGPSPISLKKFVRDKKEQYSSDEIIEFLANEEERFLKSPAYMQFFKALENKVGGKYHPKNLPASINKMFKKLNKDPDVMYQVYYLGCLKPLDDDIAELENKNLIFDRTTAYAKCEKPYVEMMNDKIFRTGLTTIGRRL